MRETKGQVISKKQIISKNSFQSFNNQFDFEKLLFMKVVTRERARELDRETAEKFGVPTLLLMENAGRGIAQKVLEFCKENGKNVLVVAGSGNNGGDGFCATRHLLDEGVQVKVALLSDEEKIRGDALLNFQAIRKRGVEIRRIRDVEELKKMIDESDVVIDAIFGTGLSRPIEDEFLLEVIRSLNSPRKKGKVKVVSVDIPSGLDSNRGIPLPEAVEADATVTFAPAKVGLFLDSALRYVGKVEVVKIGIPVELWQESDFEVVEMETVRNFLPVRPPDAHKGKFGHLLVVAGGLGRAGAVRLCAEGALRVGVGLVTIITPDVIYTPVASGRPEYMVIPAPSKEKHFSQKACDVIAEHLEGKTAVLFGPGVWVSRDVFEVLSFLANECAKRGIPLLVDADGLNCIVEFGLPESFTKAQTVITPHPGEAGRILKLDSKEIQKDRIESAKKLAEFTGGVAVLKGARTITTDGKSFFINSSGSVALATGGTGDVLSGVIAGLLAQGLEPLSASVLGVWLHGRAGQIVQEKVGYPLSLAGEVAKNITCAMAELLQI